MTIGQMVYQFLTKLDWFSTLFPRIPVPIQKQIEKRLDQYCRDNSIAQHELSYKANANRGGIAPRDVIEPTGGRGNSYADEQYESRHNSRGSSTRPPPVVNYRTEHDDRERERRRDYEDFHESVRDYERAREKYREREKKTSRDRDRVRSRSRSRERSRRDVVTDKREIELPAYKDRERSRDKHKKKKHKHHRSRSRSRSKREHKHDREKHSKEERHYR